jgi:hypothetical protein
LTAQKVLTVQLTGYFHSKIKQSTTLFLLLRKS